MNVQFLERESFIQSAICLKTLTEIPWPMIIRLDVESTKQTLIGPARSQIQVGSLGACVTLKVNNYQDIEQKHTHKPLEIRRKRTVYQSANQQRVEQNHLSTNEGQ